MADTKYTSHDLAKSLRLLAEKLEQAEPFAVRSDYTPRLDLHYHDKPDFIAAAKVIGGVKDGDTFYELKREWNGCLRTNLSIMRSAICHKVTKSVTHEVSVWECDPLLTEAEEQSITEVA